MDGAALEFVSGHDRADFFIHISAFQIQNAFFKTSFHPGIEIREGGYGAGDYPVKGAAEAFCAGVDNCYIRSKRICEAPSDMNDSLYNFGFAEDLFRETDQFFGLVLGDLR